jgi:predicted esterase
MAAGTFGPLDLTRRFAVGFSSGGYMTSRMAVSYSGTFRALAIDEGSYATCLSAVCVVPSLPANHPPTLFLQGGLDPVVPLWTMELYNQALVAQGTETRVVIDPTATHQWLNVAPVEVPAWIRAHDGP